MPKAGFAPFADMLPMIHSFLLKNFLKIGFAPFVGHQNPLSGGNKVSQKAQPMQKHRSGFFFEFIVL